MIPDKTSPLTKAIRTSEGVLVYLVNIALVVGAAIPSDHLSAKRAATLAIIMNGLHLVSRTLLKITAIQKGVGIGDAITPAALTSGVGKSAATLAESLIPQLVSDYEEFENPPPDQEDPPADLVQPETAQTPDVPPPVPDTADTPAGG